MKLPLRVEFQPIGRWLLIIDAEDREIAQTLYSPESDAELRAFVIQVNGSDETFASMRGMIERRDSKISDLSERLEERNLADMNHDCAASLFYYGPIGMESSPWSADWPAGDGEHPIARVQWYEDNGDPSVGIPSSSFPCLSPDQSDTWLESLHARLLELRVLLGDRIGEDDRLKALGIVRKLLEEE